MPAALFARSQPDRKGLLQDQTLDAPRPETHTPSPLALGIIRAVRSPPSRTPFSRLSRNYPQEGKATSANCPRLCPLWLCTLRLSQPVDPKRPDGQALAGGEARREPLPHFLIFSTISSPFQVFGTTVFAAGYLPRDFMASGEAHISLVMGTNIQPGIESAPSSWRRSGNCCPASSDAKKRGWH